MVHVRSKLCPFFTAFFLGIFSVPFYLYAQDFAPNELVVKFKNDAPELAVDSVISPQGISILTGQSRTRFIKKIQPAFSRKNSAQSVSVSAAAPVTFSATPSHLVRIGFADAQSTDNALSVLQQNPLVEYVQRNYLYKIDQTPDDSAASSQWNLQRIGIFQLWASGFFDKIKMDSVRVGVLDTGVDYLHPDLAGKIYINKGETGLDQYGHDKRTNGIDDDGDGYVDDWHGYDFVDLADSDLGDWSQRDNDPMDENGHGTAVAGIIGAQANNIVGIAGISPIAQIVPLRAFNANGVGTDADIAAAVLYAADNGIQVLNMSFGDVILSPLMRDVLHYAHEKNVVLVASSGNDGTSYPHYPSDFSDVISVGSVSQNDVRSIFSSYGPSLALVAPGESIPTLTLGGGYTGSFSGTSAAAPHVSAVASLLISLDQSLDLNSANYIPITPEEVRANILAGCEDLGDNGWDNYYGAGIVNARILLNTPERNVVQITSPLADAQLGGNVVPVVGTATTDQLSSVSVMFGAGDSPTSWTTIAQYGARHFINDTLATWEISSLTEGVYTLRLQVQNIQSGEIESRARVLIARSGPIVTNFTFQDSVISGSQSATLFTLRLNNPCTAQLWFRRHGSMGEFNSIPNSGVQLNHFFLLFSSELISGASYDFYLLATDQAGRTVRFPTVALAGTDTFTYTFNNRNISSTGFDESSFSLPSGFILNRTDSIAGRKMIIINEYDSSGTFGKLKAYQYLNGSFIAVDSTARKWVPRDFRQVYSDGTLSTLVQDQGVTVLFTSDQAGTSFFKSISFGDSTDVWASQLYDFDGDGKPDLVARSSSQYLIYKNMGSNGFKLMARLDDPTSPLPGDATNQFGPPRSLVGDFSGSGSTEIIFADYDGDMIMYRLVDKTNFTFQLAWVDSTDLLETSDYLAQGDFEGNGTMDFAIAGHSNLDLNADREYDPPTWDVRIFKHRPGDSINNFSKIWDQTFFGVKTGFSYDNGITSGKALSPTRDQLFLSLNPYLYIIDYDQSSQTFRPVWIHSSGSNSVLVSDLNGSGTPFIGFNSGGRTRFFTSTMSGNKPQAPWALSAIPVSSHAVALQWSSAVQSALHRIYRDTIAQVHTFLAGVTGTSFMDSTVSAGVTYWYAVTAVSPTESDFSSVVSTSPHDPARIDSVVQQSSSQISIRFSYPFDHKRLTDASIVVDDSVRPSSVGDQTPVKLLATFLHPLVLGVHTLHIQNLIDATGMEVDTSQRFSFDAQLEATPTFYIKSASFMTQSTIAIDFSDTLAPSALDVNNYRFSNALRTFVLKEVRSDSTVATRAILSLQDNQRLTPIGFLMTLTASDKVLDTKGQSLNDGKGQSIGLVIDIENLDNIVVFPDPLHYSAVDGSRDHITFANVPQYCRIDIFTPTGVKVTTLEGNTAADGIRWNLIDERGRGVGTGIYIFLATQLNANKDAVRTKAGKFAIIR